MKTIKFIATAMIAVFIGANTFAQTSKPSGAGKSETKAVTKSQTTANAKTETFKVAGNCDLCKTKIEKAAKINGVTKAEWDINKKLLTVVYNPAKVKSESVLKHVAAAGYDTEKFKADDKVYSSLPGCCQYPRLK
jgi:copper chaperone CopZ